MASIRVGVLRSIRRSLCVVQPSMEGSPYSSHRLHRLLHHTRHGVSAMSRQVIATLALLAILLGSSFLSPLQQHAYLPNFKPEVQGFKPVGTDSLKVFFD